MAAAADPRAVDAALEMLRAGGSAVDAAIAAEAVLGLVEPQSSGIGGGGFLIHYNARDEAIVAYDGREHAPMSARPDMFMSNGRPMAFMDAQASGRSIGTPSLIAMLKMAHDERGRLPWAQLFEPAIRLAENGFAVTPRLHAAIAQAGERQRLRGDFAARAYFFDTAGAPWPVGHMLRNPEYARTLRAIAGQGPRALSEGPIAEGIVAAAQRGPRAGALTLVDLQIYEPRRLEPLCAPFRVYRVCTMPSPSSANAMLSILGLYERARPDPVGPANADDWAAYVWASRLSYVDRDYYMADDRFAPVPTRELIAPGYLDQRAALIDLQRAPERVLPGAPAGEDLLHRWGSAATREAGTTHISIVDREGNAVALTATIESLFGAQRMTHGFLLNNELTDFSLEPMIGGLPVANAVEPGKAPRSSMSPAIVTDRNGELVMVAGSPGGSNIIASVARTIIGVLDWDMHPQDATGTANLTARFSPIVVERGRMPTEITEALRTRGWQVQEADLGSGITAIQITPQGLRGGADPRQEGAVGRIGADEP
jgi:gamma-glutamyltranspeptidase/glutathione hydrolase